jgi:hypothetical protein
MQTTEIFRHWKLIMRTIKKAVKNWSLITQTQGNGHWSCTRTRDCKLIVRRKSRG